MTTTEPISEQGNSTASGCGRVLFAVVGLLFALIGLGFLVFFSIIPAYKKYVSKDWPTAKCEIELAEMEVHHGDDSTSYSIDFMYSFSVDGKEYDGTRYSFVGSSGKKSEARRQQKAYPVGSIQECYYNPQDPSDCVLDRTNPDQNWVAIFLPSVFMVVGSVFFLVGTFGWGMKDKAASLRSVSAGKESGASSAALGMTLAGDSGSYATVADQQDAEWASPRKLKPAQSRLAAFIALSIFALIWNGFLAIFFLVPDGPMGGGGWFAIGFSLFMIPFLLVGIAVICGAVYFFLAMFNPTVEIALSSAAVPLGGTFDIAWEVEGKIERIKKLTITVEAMQLATYQRGTDTTTDREVFELLPVAEVDEVTQVAFGSESVTIPLHTMHTFEAPRNEIKWKVIVYGDIPWAPNIQEEFEFRVTPNFEASNN